MTLQSKIEQALALAKNATTGPWRAGGDEGWPIGSFSTGNSGIDGKDYTVWTAPMHGSELGDSDAKTDAEFIAASRTLLPQLARALGVAAEGLREIAEHKVNIVNVHSHAGEALAEIEKLMGVDNE